MLTVEQLRESFEYLDGALFWRVRTHGRGGTRSPGDRAGWAMQNGYWIVGLRGSKMLEHRAIFAIVHGRLPGKVIDHIDGDPLNNKVENLREGDQSMNMQNVAGPLSNNKLGVRGVCFHEKKNVYVAELKLRRKRVFHASFKTLDEAIVARLDAERRFHPFSPRVAA